MKTYHHILILLFLASVLFFHGLGHTALTDPDETFYAQTAKEMIETNQWVTPYIFGEPQFEKPILYYWFVKTSFLIFGINEFAARLPSAILALIGIFAFYFLVKLLYSPSSAFLSSVILLTSVLYIILARACVTDMTLTVFILLSLTFFLYGWDKNNKIFYYLASVSAGLAFLTKGPIGLLIPLAPIFIFLATGKRWGNLSKIPLLPSLLFFLLTALPWYYMAYRAHGTSFISEFFGFQNITRFMVPEHRIGDSPFFYIPVVLGGIFPWTTFFIPGAWSFIREKSPMRDKGYKTFILGWFLFTLIFFTASRTKLVTYIFPIFPAAALFAGKFFFDLEKNTKDNRSVNYTYISLIVSGIAASLAGYFLLKTKYPEGFKAIILSFSILMPFISLSYYLSLKRKITLSIMAVAVGLTLLSFPLFKTLAPIMEKESSKYLSELALSLAGENDIIGGECDHRRGVAFYTNRTDVPNVHPYLPLSNFLARDEKVWAIAQLKHIRQVKENDPEIQFRIKGIKGKYALLTNKPAE